ncbi:hypothetical protein SSBR45G_32440 [Bradyrhizobium sp. SSBR45G]|uniref:hypothetical protein n=1 Tax=unclassified Bradyrhizobium TaxID=2631580 RepID=UPI002342A356|nr:MULTISPECIES: hypothetical protein [unclassified Bradyrhizobium]GLH78335.1 hypothetical protein SSBR45G_32440 [Bradyrhizobium sp. SSBR45G]GLH86118.1 hypothetical protein SSBR45R_35780 [Bradyrhizobium sp. SSBR45R]
MAKAGAKAADFDFHARSLAAGLAKGRMPRPTPEIERFLLDNSTEIFAAAEGVCRNMPPDGDDEVLGIAYLFLLQILLAGLNQRVRRGAKDAADLIARFQSDLAERAEAGEIDGTLLAYLGGALQQAGIAASPELTAVSAELGGGDGDEMLPSDIVSTLDEILKACDGDSFQVVFSFAEGGHLLPDDAKIALAIHLVQSERPDARAAAVLFLQSGSPAVRKAAAAALVEQISTLSPVDLRRVIAMRNWRPEGERAAIDAIIHKARAAGVACASWPKGSADTLKSSAIDGSGAQLFIATSPIDRKTKRVSTIFTRTGITEAMTSPPQPLRAVKEMMGLGIQGPLLDVSRAYVDRMVGHHLGLTIKRGEVPPAGLLQVAETIGGADWQPARLDCREVLNELIADLPEELRDPADVALALADSDDIFELDDIQDSWFEDDAELEQKVKSSSGRARAKLPAKLLLNTGAIGAQRARWAELFVMTALWLRERPRDQSSGWADLVVVARAVLDGHDLGQIGLMRAIAERTVEYLAEDDDDLQDDPF